jgi:hypothetical protein
MTTIGDEEVAGLDEKAVDAACEVARLTTRKSVEDIIRAYLATARRSIEPSGDATAPDAVTEAELARYICRCNELSACGEYPWWSRLAEILSALSSPQGEQGGWRPPRLTDAMILAACEAHYGKRLVARSGGPEGIAMTVEGIDWTFTKAFRRMWKGALAAAPRPADEGGRDTIAQLDKEGR